MGARYRYLRWRSRSRRSRKPAADGTSLRLGRSLESAMHGPDLRTLVALDARFPAGIFRAASSTAGFAARTLTANAGGSSSTWASFRGGAPGDRPIGVAVL